MISGKMMTLTIAEREKTRPENIRAGVQKSWRRCLLGSYGHRVAIGVDVEAI